MKWPQATLLDSLASAEVFVDGDWVESKDQDPEGDVRLVQLADVGDGEYVDKSDRFLTSAKARELRCTFLKPGDVLVARMPDPLGRACIFPGDPKPSVTVVDVCIIRPDPQKHDARWLMHCLNAPDCRNQIAGYATGTTRSRISRGNLGKIRIPLLPLPGGRSQPRIQKGAIFVRRVASNQILVSADFENLVNRRIDRFRDRILEGLTKVVRAEADEEIVTVRVAPTKGGARNVTIVSAAESLAISGKTVSIALNGITDRVSAYMALSSSGGGAVVPEAFLYEAYASRAELQDADQYEWLALESLVVGVPAFYWLSHLDKAIAKSIIDAASKRARWCREQVRDVAGFYGETLYKKLNDRLEDHGLKKAFRPKAQLFGTSKSKVPIADSARATDQAKALAERSDASLRWQLVKLDCALYAPF